MSSTYVSLIQSLLGVSERHPNRTAIVASDGTLTYRNLVNQISDMGWHLRRQGVLEGDVVAIAAKRGLGQFVGVLATMWVGATFAVIDLEQPVARRRAQCDASGAGFLLAEENDNDMDTPQGLVLLPLEQVGDAGASMTTEPAVVDGSDAAYIVFTSGSTGNSKAVVVPHRALFNYCRSILERITPFRDGDEPLNFASVTSLATDLGHTAVFPPLTIGDCVHLVDWSVMLDPPSLSCYVERHQIDVMKSTPSHVGTHLDVGAFGMLPARLLILGGEALPWELIDKIAQVSSCRVMNHYGPSETTVGVLTYAIDGPPAEHRACTHVPLGTPLRGVSALVVDSDLQELLPGQEGELLIIGPSVALGYLGEVNLTRHRFVDLSVNSIHGTPPGQQIAAYRSGDSARVLSDGVIEFRGRRDRQVKLRGHRVEPGEIEHALKQHNAVKSATVVADEEKQGLAAFVTLHEGRTAKGDEIRAYLRDWVPTALLPVVVEIVDHFPLTSSGKLDTRRLAQLLRAGRLRQ